MLAVPAWGELGTSLCGESPGGNHRLLRELVSGLETQES